jgi:hypothetical protein
MKVSELTGETLDYWVARAANIAIKRRADGFLYTDEDHPKLWQPSNFWDTAGPIIERERIALHVTFASKEENQDQGWWASADRFLNTQHYGPTPRIAGMRAFVASKFGDTVPDNE